MISYNNDQTIRFDHTPVINKIGFQINQIGPDDPYVFPDKDYTDTDANTIYVNGSTAGDDGNAGTEAAPKETLLAAINATTAIKTKVVVQDSAIYNEDISGGTYTYLQGVYNDTAQTSSWVGRLLGFTPNDSNAVFVAKTGSDSTGTAGTQADPWLTINAAILDCDTGRDVIVIMDSETYEEEGFEFTGNFTGLYAAIGQTPVIKILENKSSSYFNYAKTTNHWHYAGVSANFCKLNNGNYVVVHNEGAGGATRTYYTIINETGAVVKAKAEVIAAETTGRADICPLHLGGFVISFEYNYNAYAYQYDAAGAYVRSYNPGGCYNGGPTVLTGLVSDQDRFVMIHQDNTGGTDQYLRMSIYRGDTGATIIENVSLSMSMRGEYNHRIIFIEKLAIGANAGKFFFSAYSYNLGGSPGDFYVTKIYDEDGNVAYTETSPTNLNYAHELSDGKLFATRFRCASGYLAYAVYNADLTVSVTQTNLHAISTYQDICRSGYFYSSKYIFITYCTTAAYSSYLTIIDATTYAVCTSAQLMTTGSETYVRGCAGREKTLMLLEPVSGAPYPVLQEYGEFTYSGILSSVDSNLNGITIDTDSDSIYQLLYNSEDFTFKWCKLLNEEYDSALNTTIGYMAQSAKQIDVYNSIISGNSAGIKQVSNTAVIRDSQFYRINLGYTIDITGTGPGINIEHCDFFDCYGGVHLENNDGGEVIKNCIFHDISVYAIDAEIALTVTYSVVTSSVTVTVTLGSYTNRGNPDYVNEGYVDPTDTDLDLRVKVLGYPGNSAAYSLADDSRNAGSIDVQYIGASTDYTSITVPKPNSMKVDMQYAGATNTQKRDGTWSSSKAGQSEVVTMTWTGIAAAYMALLITMWKSSESDVLIYPSPVTYAASFEQWTLIREAMSNSTESPTQSDLGAQGVTLKFAKAV